jgi:hypothetical protein
VWNLCRQEAEAVQITMKTKRAIGVAVLLALAVALGYWLGYQDGTSRGGRLNTVSSPRSLLPRLIGLPFRQWHNDVSRPKLIGVTNATWAEGRER